MTHTLPGSADMGAAVAGALDYEAPFLVEKLLGDRVVDTAEEAGALFTEVKRYLVLCDVDQTRTWMMCSRRGDETWHQFILFTAEYTAFCDKYFGEYLHHCPSNAPDSDGGHRAAQATFAEFGDRYRQLFGTGLPDLWDDSHSVTARRRMLNDHCGQLAVGSAGGKVELIGPHGRAVLRVNDIAGQAVGFIASTAAFYVRELPGELTDEEKIRLAATLVDMGLLRVS